ncbi:hypothetical protein BDP27DRAFT_1432195 [Rhodocollybia butyracea]|uniref:Uncharacterized protein n=1 Tax=Rhodocollybia butyracea TaxID=206335 RepID=A0A9P5P4T3_9AGAR|nr:hypothetical protein BDP27DRAFT_1432195 [Rhodocollybia butyracea]
MLSPCTESAEHSSLSNACVTLWTPNLPHPAVKVLEHLGPVASVTVDPSEGGRYMATAGKIATLRYGIVEPGKAPICRRLGSAFKALGSSSRVNEILYSRLSRAERLQVSGKADLTEAVASDANDKDADSKGEIDKEEREKRKMRGKGKSVKRYLRKQRINVIDPTAVAIRAKLEKLQAERKAEIRRVRYGDEPQEKSLALDRFKRTSKT